MTIPVIIDCDPGLDDVVALVLALGNDKLNVKGITTVAGNQTLDKVTKNTLKVLSLLDRKDIDVAMGYETPMLRELVIAEEVHGRDGLFGVELPKVKKDALDIHALEFMKKIIENSKKNIRIISLGPLTNIAQLLLKYPNLKDDIREITIMGGGIREGNRSPVSEFNIFVDPEAAKIVFNSGIPINMIGLDVTHSIVISKDDILNLKQEYNKVSELVVELLINLSKYHTDDDIDGCYLHDPMAVAAVISPEIFKFKKLKVDIETQGELTRGQTVGSFNNRYNKNPNTNVAIEIKKDEFMKLIKDSISKF